MDLPSSLHPLRPYLQHAKQIGNFEPLVAYYCRYFAIQLGTELLSQHPSPEAKNTILTLLEKVEEEKKALLPRLKDPANKAPYVLAFANKIFDKANAEDEESKATRTTALSFYASSIFYEVLKQFGELEPDVVEKQKYGKWKASDISSSLKQGRTPISGDAHRPKEVKVVLPSVECTPIQEEGKKEEKQEKQENQEPKEAGNKEEEGEEEKEDEPLPLTYTQQPYDTMGVSPESIDDAHRFARYATSALQFEDRVNAITNLVAALRHLGVEVNLEGQ